MNYMFYLFRYPSQRTFFSLFCPPSTNTFFLFSRKFFLPNELLNDLSHFPKLFPFPSVFSGTRAWFLSKKKVNLFGGIGIKLDQAL